MKLPSKAAFLRAINKTQAFIKEKPYVLMLTFVVVGVLTLIFTSAASTTVSLQPEDAACAGLKQTTASGYSGSGYVRFATNPCPSTLGSDFYPQSNCSALSAGQYCFQRMGLGAGGWMSGIDVGIDDTVAMRTDASVPVVLEKDSAGKDVWIPILSKSSLPSSVTSDSAWMIKQQSSGASEIAVYNKNLLYYRGFYDAQDSTNDYGLIWKADKSSGSWKLTRITASSPTLEANLYMDANEQPGGEEELAAVRYRSKYMVISKTNPNVIYVSAYDGVWRTGDAGGSWNKVYSWDANQCRQLYNGCSSMIVNDAEGKVYVFIKDIGGLMTDKNKILSGNITGGNLTYTGQNTPDSVRNIVYDGVGTVYYTVANNTLWRLKGGVHTRLTTLPSMIDHPVGIAAHKDGKTITVMVGGAHTYATSNDQGNTWPLVVGPDASGASLTASDVPWMMSPNKILTEWGGEEDDPSVIGQIAYQGDRLWITEGIGAYYRDPSMPPKSIVGLSRGIENMINSHIIVFRDMNGKSRIMWSMHDRGAMMQKWSTDISEVAKPAAQTYAPKYEYYDSLRHGQSPGSSPDGKYVISGQFFGYKSRIICSSNSGDTVRSSNIIDDPWKAIGSYVVNNSGKGLFVPMKPQEIETNSGVRIPDPTPDNPSRTRPELYRDINADAYGIVDCNATTPTLTIKKMPSNISITDHDSAQYGATKQLAAVDDNGTFYMAVASGTGSGYNASLNAVNVYSSIDLVNWTSLGKAGPMPDAIFGVKIKAAPGTSWAGVVFATNGDSAGPDSICDSSIYSFVRSPSSNQFKAIPNLTEVLDFGFGLPITSGAFPQVYASGCYNGKYGIWTSTDFNPTTAAGTWIQIDNDTLWKNPTAQAGPMRGIDGDKVRIGCFYMIHRENGAYYACKK